MTSRWKKWLRKKPSEKKLKN